MQLCWIHLLALTYYLSCRLSGIFYIYKIMSSVNRDHFTFSFSIGMLFISFSCPTALAKTSSIMFNRSGTSGHLVSFLIWGRKLSVSLLSLSMMLAVGTKILCCPGKHLGFLQQIRFIPKRGATINKGKVSLFKGNF